MISYQRPDYLVTEEGNNNSNVTKDAKTDDEAVEHDQDILSQDRKSEIDKQVPFKSILPIKLY